MINRQSSLLLAFAFFLFSFNGAAQQTSLNQETAERAAAEARRKLESRALDLLDEVASEAATLRLAENRIRLQTTAADLLWARQTERARLLFKQATDDLAALAGRIDPENPQAHNDAQMVNELRHEMLNVISKRDVKLALEFLRTTRAPSPFAGNPNYRQPDQELALELSLAQQITAQDPKQAIRMAEESLDKGPSSHLINILHQLRGKDEEAAAKLAGDIIRKLRPEDFAVDYEAMNVAVNLLQITRARGTAASQAPLAAISNAAGLSARGGITIDEPARRMLIEKTVAAVSSLTGPQAGNAPGLFASLSGIMPEIEKYAPGRVAALRRKTNEFKRALDPRAQMWQEYQEVIQRGTIEALVEAAAKAPIEMRDHLYNQAAWKALGQNDRDRARQFAGNISNPQQRAHTLRELDRQSSWRAAEQGSFAEARQLLASLPSTEERVALLINLSSLAANRQHKEAARQFLEEARGLVGLGHAENPQQFTTQLQLAGAYAAYDSARSFELLGAAVARLNELLAAAAVVDRFGHNSFTDGELKPSGGSLWNELVRQCAEQLTTLAATDFDRALSLTQQFERVEVRTFARLKVAQGILSAPEAQLLPVKRLQPPFMGGGGHRRRL